MKVENKTCSKCGELQNLSEFAKDKNRKDGLHPHCKTCRRNYGTPYARKRRSNPILKARELETSKRWRMKNPEKYKESTKRSNSKKTKEDQKSSFIKSVYGITLDEYNTMLEMQNGVCAICSNKEVAKSRYTGTRRLSIDHDHKTGKIRGLLCSKCNFGISAFHDDIEKMFSAIIYLQTNNKNNING